MRRLAHHYLQQENHAHTLQPTALVHEVYLHLFKPAGGAETVEWQDRNHFFVIAARQMRRILVDHARAKRAAKREGDLQRVALNDQDAVALPPDADLLALNDALSQLAELHPRPAQVVELRYFAGLTEKEAADVLNIGLTTLKREWEFARAWLFKQLKS